MSAENVIWSAPLADGRSGRATDSGSIDGEAADSAILTASAGLPTLAEMTGYLDGEGVPPARREWGALALRLTLLAVTVGVLMLARTHL